jgi:hypothetical protein
MTIGHRRRAKRIARSFAPTALALLAGCESFFVVGRSVEVPSDFAAGPAAARLPRPPSLSLEMP